MEGLIVDCAEFGLNILLIVVRRISSALKLDHGSSKDEVGTAGINEINILLTCNNLVAFHDRPGLEVRRLNAVPDISAEERITNVALFPLRTILAVDEFIDDVEVAKHLSEVSLLWCTHLACVSVLALAHENIFVSFEEGLTPEVAPWLCHCKLRVLCHIFL